jgi:hypothetical protein
MNLERGLGQGECTPILGQYESGDEFVTARHIDWASGFGIKSFSLNSAGPLDHSDARIDKTNHLESTDWRHELLSHS